MQISLSKTLLCALAALTSSVEGFTDTSPFFFFSTRDIPFPSSSLRSSASLLPALKISLSICPSDFYILVNQRGVHASDYMPARAAPRLKSRLAKADGSVKTVAAVDEVVLSGEGEQDMGIVGEAEGSLRRMLEETCGAETVVVDGTAGDLPSPKTYPRRPTVIEVDFEAPSATNRFDQLYLNDAVIASLIELLPSSNYTVVYSTTPVDSSISFPLDSEPAGRTTSSDKDQDFTAARYKFNQYDQEVYQDPEGLLNLQIKRDTNAHQKEDGKKTNDIPGGVFERYQFLSPGIFMGLFASLLFVIIISVGITAITSLEISYGSFVKDNSPQAAKKAQ